METPAIILAIIALIGTIVTGIIQLFNSGLNCHDIKSSCCIIASEIDDTEQKSDE